MGNMSEVRQLSLHPLAIHTFIKAQAGSLGKALSEAVMNSIDAFGKNVIVQLTNSGFSVEDDGQGFRDRDEIAAWFETLGFPHDEGNHRTYGKFGLGRAQMWAYAHTIWRSNQFTMAVDVKKRGLDYELSESATKYRGTKIEGEFYTPLTFQQREIVEMELANLVKYAPGLVIINGKPITKDPSLEEWTLETAEAWMRFDAKAHSLDVYNGGILVAHFPRYRFKVGGVIVTKPEHTLSLNVARNDILEAECKVWAKIAKSFPKDSIQYNNSGAGRSQREKKVKSTVTELKSLAEQVKSGELTLDAALEKAPNLLISVLGRDVPLFSMVRGWGPMTVVVTPKGDEFGKRLSKLKRGVVLAKESLDNFGFSSVTELKALVRKAVVKGDNPSDYDKRLLKSLDDSLWSDSAEAAFPDIAEGKTVFVKSEMTKEEQAAQYAWMRAWVAMGYELKDALSDKALGDKLRSLGTLQFGDSPTQTVWISDADEVVLRKAEVMKATSQSMPYILAYAARMVTGLIAHLEPDPVKANAAALEAISSPPVLGRALLMVMSNYVSFCRANDLPIPTSKLAEFDKMAVE